MTFKFLETANPELLDKIFAFRYKIINDETKYQNYMQNNTFIDKRESDEYDPFSTHFVVLDKDNKVAACVRLIHHASIECPTVKHMTFNVNINRFEKEKSGEISRIFIAEKYRNLKDTKTIIVTLMESLYLKMKEKGIEYSFGCLEKSFVRLLRIYKMAYEVIGEEQDFAGIRYPCILYTKRLEEDNPEFLTLWKEHNASETIRHAI